MAQSTTDFICSWFYKTGIQAQLSWVLPLQVGWAGVTKSAAFIWWLGQAGLEGSRKALLTWLVLGGSSTWPLCPHASLSFLTIWLSWRSQTSYMMAGFQGNTFQATKAGTADLIGLSLSSWPHFHCTWLVKTSHRTRLDSEGGQTDPTFSWWEGKDLHPSLPQLEQPSQTSNLSLKPCFSFPTLLEFLFHDIYHKLVMWCTVSLTGTLWPVKTRNKVHLFDSPLYIPTA